jgi:aspartate 4-decarboxylase
VAQNATGQERNMADLLTLRKFEALSPFEIKDELIKLAKSTSRTSQSAFLNAGRGNPNWIATAPREAFFLLGQFAITESKRAFEHPAGVGGMPQPNGIAARMESWLGQHTDAPGAKFLSSMLQFAKTKFEFNEKIVHEYLMWAMCGNPRPSGKFDLYAVEGGTAAMCYLFKTLKANRLLLPGDTIALGTPIFTPYLEMTHLEDYDLNVVQIKAPQENKFQFTFRKTPSVFIPTRSTSGAPVGGSASLQFTKIISSTR